MCAIIREGDVMVYVPRLYTDVVRASAVEKIVETKDDETKNKRVAIKFECNDVLPRRYSGLGIPCHVSCD